MKKSVYLDADLLEPLKAAASADGRSVTRQINHILRITLLHPPELTRTAVVHMPGREVEFRPYSKDQQLGRSQSKKLK